MGKRINYDDEKTIEAASDWFNRDQNPDTQMRIVIRAYLRETRAKQR